MVADSNLHRSSECWWRQRYGPCIRWRAYTLAIESSGVTLGPAPKRPAIKSALRIGPIRPKRGWRERLADFIRPETYGL